MNSIGSSTVTMWSARVRLTRSISAASVVDLPEPVGPVTRTRPRGSWAKCATLSGTPSSASCLISVGMRRNAAPTTAALLVDVHAETGVRRDREREVELELALELVRCRSIEQAVERGLGALVIPDGGGARGGSSAPSIRTIGDAPTVTCRSDARWLTTCAKRRDQFGVRLLERVALGGR